MVWTESISVSDDTKLDDSAVCSIEFESGDVNILFINIGGGILFYKVSVFSWLFGCEQRGKLCGGDYIS